MGEAGPGRRRELVESRPGREITLVRRPPRQVPRGRQREPQRTPRSPPARPSANAAFLIASPCVVESSPKTTLPPAAARRLGAARGLAARVPAERQRRPLLRLAWLL